MLVEFNTKKIIDTLTLLLWLFGGGWRPGQGWRDSLQQSGMRPEVFPSGVDLVRIQRHWLHRLAHDGGDGVLDSVTCWRRRHLLVWHPRHPGITGHPHGVDGRGSSRKFP
jgi:hypothetical protein